MRRTRSVWQRYWPIATGLAIILVLYGLGPVLAPFITGGVLAYILQPLVNWLARRRVSRGLAAALVMAAATLVLLTLLLIIVPLFVRQVAGLYAYLPNALVWVQTQALPWISQRIGADVPLDVEHIRTWMVEHGDVAGQVLQAALPSLTSGGLALLGLAVNVLLLPLVLFYFLRDWPVMLGMLDDLTPRRWHEKTQHVAAEVDGVLGQFLRGQLSVMLIMATFYSAGLWLTGLKSALPIGIIAGLLVFIPYVGVIIGVLLATLAAALQFQTLVGLLPVWGVFMAGQVVEGFFVTPKLVGERVGLAPVAVIFSLMAFGQMLGFVGVLLALPLAATVLVGLRHLRHHYFESSLYRQ